MPGGHARQCLPRHADGPRSNAFGKWSRHSDLNRGPAVYETVDSASGTCRGVLAAPPWTPRRTRSHGRVPPEAVASATTGATSTGVKWSYPRSSINLGD
jgi:hypothetical protein